MPSSPDLATTAPELRFFIGYGEVAGYYSQLAAGLHELGHPVTFVDLAPHAFGYDAADRLQPRWVSKLCSLLGRILGEEQSGRSGRRAVWAVASEVVRWIILGATVTRHDVFVLGGSRASTTGYELRLLHLLRKRVILVFNGTDARPTYLGSAHHPPTGPIDAAALTRRTLRLRRRLQRMERHADEIICHGPYGHYFTRPLARWLAVGIPSPPVDAAADHGVTPAIRILHAPSNPVVKGTDDIRVAVEGARQHGFDIDYVEMSGRPHRDVMAQLASTDLVCDQLYSDTPMAGLAAEAARIGVPSLVGGYELDEVRRIETPAEMAPPSFTSHPSAYSESLIELLGDRERIRAKGREAAAFMAGPWARLAVATRIVHLATGNWNASDRLDPAHIRYVNGAGLSDDRARAMIRAVVELGGEAALGLDHHQDVKRAMLEFAGLSPEPPH